MDSKFTQLELLFEAMSCPHWRAYRLNGGVIMLLHADSFPAWFIDADGVGYHGEVLGDAAD